VTCDTISGHYVADIGENADIGGGNNPDGEAAKADSHLLLEVLASIPNFSPENRIFLQTLNPNKKLLNPKP
jgi:hypothetical protein